MKFFRSKDTHYVLHNLTLCISDPVIRKKVDEQRCQNFASIFKPVCLISIIVVIAIIAAQWDDFITGQTIILYVRILSIFLWALIHCFLPWSAPIVTIITQLSHGLAFIIYFDKYQTADDREIEMKIHQLIIILSAINYNSFKMNLVCNAPAILIPNLLIMNRVASEFD